MNSTFLVIIVVLLLVLVVVVAYNMHQESLYRQKIRRQFGHSDEDALMNSKTRSVRDGQSFKNVGTMLRRSAAKIIDYPLDDQQKTNEADKAADKAAAFQMSEADNAVLKPADAASAAQTATPDIAEPERKTARETELPAESEKQEEKQPENPAKAAPETAAPEIAAGLSEPEYKPAKMEAAAKPAIPAAEAAPAPKVLIPLHDLENSQLLWFDKRFDFMGYVALTEPQELRAIPRFSGSHRFQIVGCTMDGLFQAAEPIPGVFYQAFVVGLQAISRSGLASAEELEYFTQQIHQFAQQMGGIASATQIGEFLKIARPLDELCARVDQTIAIHLVSHSSVSGTEIRPVVEKSGFELSEEGTFVLRSEEGNVKFTIAALDGSLFAESMLANQSYKGFTMLFDITRVPRAEDDFNEFMNLAVKLSGELGLDLVDDQICQLSTEWLKEVRSYVTDRQAEMKKAGILPNSPLAKRLFS